MPSGKSKKMKSVWNLMGHISYVNLLGDSVNTIKEKEEEILKASKDIGLKIIRTEPEYKDS
jgi:hypothetical protein